MLRRRSIAARLLLLVILGTGLVLGSSIARNYAAARRLLEQQAYEKAMGLAAGTASRVDGVVACVEKVARGVAREIEQHPPATEAAGLALLGRVVRDNREVYGSALALPPVGQPGAASYRPLYAYRHQGRIVSRRLGGPAYRWDTQSWYAEPRTRHQPVWSEPYFDRGGGEALMVTFSVPLFDRHHANAVGGVITCDVTLPWLEKLLRGMPLGKTGYSFVVSRRGTYMVHPNRYYVLRETVFHAARLVKGEDLTDVARRMVAGGRGYARLTSHVNGRPSRIAFAPIPTTGWSLAVVISQDELLAPIAQLGRQELVAAVVGFLLLSLIALAIAGSITGPIRELEAATRALAGGNLHAALPEIAGEDEVARLARSFSAMRDDLRKYVRDLRETTAANERLASELAIARTIQMSLIPHGTPECLADGAYDLCAVLDPAREVGGDFYTYLMLDDHTLGIAIGDVSGKGVPAAIFMAASTTLLKALWRQDPSPATALRRLNDELVRDNDTSMFVSLSCAALDVRDGTCRYASGGHLPPFLVRGDGSVAPLPRVRGPLVGALPGVPYEEGHLQLAAGDLLFLYTDGVTEAMTPEQELFGAERLTAVLADLFVQGALPTALDGMRTALREFAGETEQSDDIAMLAVRYRGRGR